jgi:proteasome lid subunit RPN8/RPN11
MADFYIHNDVYARLLVAAAASPAAEICGILFGGDDRIDDISMTANVASDPAIAFEVDPAALIAAHRAVRRGGPRPIGHFHSHPRGPATPSPRDLAAAEKGSLCLIVGHGNVGGEARLWREAGGNFLEVNLIFARLAPK